MNIIEQAESGFKVGDRVVWSKDEWKNLWKVISDECEGQFDLESNDKIWHVGADAEDLRPATPAEIAAGHRIDAPEINIDADFNPDSRHISPACKVSDFTGLPKPKPLYTHNELVLMHKIEHLQCSRNFYRVACAGLVAVAFCAWVGWLS